MVDRGGNLKGLITVKDIQKMIEYPNACKDELDVCASAARSVRAGISERARALVDAKVDLFALDSSHAHSTGVLDATARLRAPFRHRPDGR